MTPIKGLEDYQREVASGKCLVDFWGPSCAPCVVLSKTLANLEPEFPMVRFLSVNADEESEIAVEGMVRGLPTILLIRDGMEQERVVGVVSEGKLRNLLSSFLGSE